nr:NS4A [Kampung Karu virus]
DLLTVIGGLPGYMNEKWMNAMDTLYILWSGDSSSRAYREAMNSLPEALEVAITVALATIVTLGIFFVLMRSKGMSKMTVGLITMMFASALLLWAEVPAAQVAGLVVVMFILMVVLVPDSEKQRSITDNEIAKIVIAVLVIAGA